jgi:uncharacterized protein (TIGR02246 family)
MKADELAIRQLVETWMVATKKGDLPTVLNLMADDAIFMVPGREPFGKEVFAASSQAMKEVQIDGVSEIQELKILGDWAWIRNRLHITITPPNGKPATRSGYTLTILRKRPDGAWVLARDANLVI